MLRALRQWRRTALEAGTALLGRYARVARGAARRDHRDGVCSTLRRMPPGTVLDQLTTTACGRTLLAKVPRGGRRSARPRRQVPAARPGTVRPHAPRARRSWSRVVVAVSAVLTALPLPIRR
ncbi:hypothetical protein [Streptomyces sp. KL116D]|uniref:hypothetical protein n=1 Tax=Streptomyces sp. KL116D TaxID=3045152 RepID=UPI00355782B5